LDRRRGGGVPILQIKCVSILGAQQSKSISTFDQPFVFIVAGSYPLPKVSQLRKASYVLQDWQIGTLLTYASRLPIPVPASTSSIANQLFQGSLYDRLSGVPLYPVPSLNCHCFDPSTTPVLNPAAFIAPPPGEFGTASPFYSDFRYARHPSENINLGRTWHFRERLASTSGSSSPTSSIVPI